MANADEVNDLATEKANQTDLLVTDSIAIDAQDKANNSVAQISDNSIPSSKLDQSTNSKKIGLANLQTEVIAAMNGQSPTGTIPAVGSVTTEIMANESATTAKRTPLGEFGVMISGPSAALPNIDTVNKRLTIDANTFIVNRKTRYPISALTHVPFISGGTNQMLIFNTKTLLLSFVSSATLNDLDEFNLVLMVIALDANSKIKSVWTTSSYTIDGELGTLRDGEATSKKRTRLGELALITVSSSGLLPDHNTTLNTITFSSNFFVFNRNTRYTVSAQTLSYLTETDPSSSGVVIYFDTANSPFIFKLQNQLNNILERALLFAIAYKASNHWYLTMNCEFTVNGKSQGGGGGSKRPVLSYTFPPDIVEGFFVENKTTAYQTLNNASDVIQAFRDLASNHSKFVTVTLYGNDSSGNYPFYHYRINQEEQQRQG